MVTSSGSNLRFLTSRATITAIVALISPATRTIHVSGPSKAPPPEAEST
jgi:hypothetical protein